MGSGEHWQKSWGLTEIGLDEEWLGLPGNHRFIQDPFGHLWSVATHKEDLSPEEMEERMKKPKTVA